MNDCGLSLAGPIDCAGPGRARVAVAEPPWFPGHSCVPALHLAMSERRRPGHVHAVRFFDSTPSLVEIVAGFLADGFRSGQPALILATSRHTPVIEAQLRALGCDVDRLVADDELIIADAERHLARFMLDGTPVKGLFLAATSLLIERACRARPRCAIRAYGEMVDVLWQRGQMTAAIELEMLWNELAASRDFDLLCGYSTEPFAKGVETQEIQRHHTHVVSDTGAFVPTT